jgi:hypothetical protein
MKHLCLNCRGLGQLEAVRELCSLCELHRPWVVFLSETRFFNDRVDGLVRTLGMKGGIALLWSPEVEVRLESYDKLHIDVTVHPISSELGDWRFTGFYGESKRELRYRSWDLMKLLVSRTNLPWLCAGDFNEVLLAQEQFGGQGRTEQQMNGFREAVAVWIFRPLFLWTSLYLG